MTDFTYAAVFLDRAEESGDWKESVRDALAAEGIRLVERDRGEMELRGDDGHLMGWARFDETSSAAKRPALAAWIAAGKLGRAAGVLWWTHPAADIDEKSRLIRAIARGARGAVSHRASDEVRELTTTRSFSLSELTSSYGFAEGDLLLDRRPGRYLQDAIERVSGILARAGLEASVAVAPDERHPDGNTLRLFPPLVRGGEQIPVEETDRTLRLLDELPLQVIDRAATDPDDWFWID